MITKKITTVRQFPDPEHDLVEVRITQDYNEAHDMGHYRGYIMDQHHNILHVFENGCSLFDGKIDDETCDDHYNRWSRNR